MRLDWDRPGVVRATLKVGELAALVAGARLVAVALAGQSPEQGDQLERVLADFDRAVKRLGPTLDGGNQPEQPTISVAAVPDR